jgi:hypothetical protein
LYLLHLLNSAHSREVDPCPFNTDLETSGEAHISPLLGSYFSYEEHCPGIAAVACSFCIRPDRSERCKDRSGCSIAQARLVASAKGRGVVGGSGNARWWNCRTVLGHWCNVGGRAGMFAGKSGAVHQSRLRGSLEVSWRAYRSKIAAQQQVVSGRLLPRLYCDEHHDWAQRREGKDRHLFCVLG